jgi:hypothetical protein
MTPDKLRYFEPYPRSRLICSSDGTGWGAYGGRDCAECVFIPANTPHRGRNISSEIWSEFAGSLTDGAIKLRADDLFLVGPDDEITQSISDIDRYKSVIAQNRIRARHGRPSVKITKPWIFGIAEQQFVDLPMVLSLRPHCEYLVVQTFDGWVVFNSKQQAMRGVLEPLAGLFGAEMIIVNHKDLPQD